MPLPQLTVYRHGRRTRAQPGSDEPSAMASARLRRLNHWLVESLREGLVVAETDSLRGCAFGFPVRDDGSWWLGFEGTLPRGVGQLTRSGGGDRGGA